MDSIHDVERILLSKKNNLVARRWARNKRIRLRILEHHLYRNGDLLKLNQINSLRTLEESIEEYLENPVLIDDQYK